MGGRCESVCKDSLYFVAGDCTNNRGVITGKCCVEKPYIAADPSDTKAYDVPTFMHPLSITPFIVGFLVLGTVGGLMWYVNRK